jgi:phytoene dehydrogenase-like protein
MSGQSADAVVIGAGHNGLVAAAMLADAGWDVLVLEAQAEPGGAVESAELFSGYASDLYSAFCPLSVASPVFGALGLEDHGLRWTHAPAVVGHVVVRELLCGTKPRTLRTNEIPELVDTFTAAAAKHTSCRIRRCAHSRRA